MRTAVNIARFRLAAAGLLMLTAPVLADTSRTRARAVTQLADGVYTIRHVDPFPGYVHGNTTVIIGDREVFVVDSCNTSAAAKEDIAQIRQWTAKPVRWVLNTHWHQDHNAGNKDYLEAFPGVAILAHTETKAMLDATTPHVSADGVRILSDALEQTKKTLARGKGATGKPLSDAGRKDLEEQIAAGPSMLESLRTYVYQPPTMAFEESLTIDLGGREVQVTHPGRGNTGGDAIAYLPKERILIVGDLVVHPVPFTFDGYPSDWVHTLDTLAAFDATTIVPGHGEVEHDKTYLLALRSLLQSVVSQVNAQVLRNSEVTLDEVKKQFDIKNLRQKTLGEDKEDAYFFDYAMASFTSLAFYEAKQR
ncbi:MAG: MBL fold metallo-hydrolase [Acidobacteriota bacterium]